MLWSPVRFVLFWLVLAALCAALNESTDLSEWVLAIGCGALVAVVGTLASRMFGVRPGLPRRPVTLLLVPVDIVRDTWRLVLDLPRLRRPGRRSTRIASARSDAEAAWAVLVASAAPGGFVVDAEEDDRGVRLVLHTRTEPGPAMTRTLAPESARGTARKRREGQ